MGTRCRLCATSYSNLVSILEDTELVERIDHLFQVTVFAEDRLPTVICYACKEIVNNTWEFTAQVQKAQELLSEVLIEDNNGVANPDPLLHPMGMGMEKPLQRQKGKNKTKKGRTRDRNVNENSEGDGLAGLSDSERNDDGSVTPKQPLDGWTEYLWQCCECSGSVNTADELRDHYATIHGQPPRFPCADCPKVYTKYSIFVAHVRVHRPRLKFCCDVCGKWFASVKSQDRHR